MSTNNKITITAVSDGPYIVKNLQRLANQKGAIETEETIALCRCGRSSNKPYCDGTHKNIGFSTANPESSIENRQLHYTGKSITIHDNRSICAHAGYCTDSLSSVFRMKQEPWINPDAATTEEIIAAVQKCPSGALSYTLENSENNSQNNEPGIFIAPDAPYVVSGCPELEDTNWAEGANRQLYTLCRCGASNNKPFCDGSHWSIEFKDEKN